MRNGASSRQASRPRSRWTTNLQEQVRELLNRQVGRDLRLSIDVDPEIIGGFVARVGDRVLDGSTRSRLRNLRDWLRESAVLFITT